MNVHPGEPRARERLRLAIRRLRKRRAAPQFSANELYTLMSWFTFVERAELDTLYDRMLLERVTSAFDALQSGAV